MTSALYRRTFPVGVWWSGATIDLPNATSAGGTTTISPGDATGTTALLTNRQFGYLANNVREALWYFSVPAVQEDTQAVSAKLDAAGIRHVVGPTGRTGAVGTGVEAEFYDADPATWTQANADAIAAPIVANYQAHPSLLGYNLEDDVNSSTAHRDAVVLMAQAFQDADPDGRPAFFVHLFPENENLWDAYDCKVAFTYRYPCGKTAGGVDTPEGDFHRSTFAGVPNLGGGGNDWVDALRQWFAYVPSGAVVWLVLQTHNTTTGSAASQLRQPTDRELRAQFWIAVGEGVKGIWWFRGDNITADSTSDGVFDDGRRSALAVVSELSGRLTPAIRRILLGCARTTDAFTTTGGGSSGYPVNYASAYVSTLLHDDGTRYVVVCNRSTSAAAVTIASATLDGTLTNLEDGATIRVGGSRTLPALDGTVFRYDPDLGVPEVVPAFGYATVVAWWARHYANPASTNHIPVGDVQTHPAEVVVAAGELQAAIDASTGPTTFRLQAGNHPRVTIVGRSNLHFIANSPDSRPVCRGFDVFGSTYAQQYNTAGTDYGFPHHLITLKTAAALAAWRNPQEDLLWRGIDFQSDGTLVQYAFYQFDNGTWNNDHRWENVPLFLRNVKRVLIEDCTASGYLMGTPDSDPIVTGIQTTYNSTGTLPNTHPGLFCGNSGIENVVIRDCDLAGTTNASRGFPYPIFFDGARGCVFHDIRCTGKWSAGWLLLLTNGDFTFDQAYDGTLTEDDFRDARCNVASAWACDNTVYGQTAGHAIMGGNNLIADCTQNAPGGSLTYFVEFACKAPIASVTAQGKYYRSWHNVVDGCDITAGGATTFVRHDVDQGIVGSDPTHPYRSRVGITTVTDNHVAGSLGSWISTKAGATATVDTPHTESGNTTG